MAKSMNHFAVVYEFEQQTFLHTGINILSIELVDIKTFVSSLGNKEKAKAHCGLSEDKRTRLKLNFRIKVKLNY